MPYAALDIKKAEAIKAAVWNGVPQSKVASDFAVSQPTVSLIVNGFQYFEAEWPDGTKGQLSIIKKAELRALRYESTRHKRVTSELGNIAEAVAHAVAGQLDHADIDDGFSKVLEPQTKGGAGKKKSIKLSL